MNVKRILLAAILAVSQLSILTSATAASTDAFNLLSFNIRYNTTKDGDNAWPFRKQHVSDLIQFHQADIVGLQEARLDQLNDLTVLLPEYAWYGFARDDGKTSSPGEYAAILYRKDKMTLNKQGSFWCSTTPEVPSKSWDSKYKRNVNWAYFTRSSGKRFYFFNAHFDHKGKTARAECAKLLRTRIDQIAGDKPVIVTGDFNAKPFEQSYLNLTDNQPYHTDIFDAKKISNLKPYGPKYTSTGFDISVVRKHPIDYVFVSDDFTVNRFGVLTDSLHGRLPSDHYPLLVDINLH